MKQVVTEKREEIPMVIAVTGPLAKLGRLVVREAKKKVPPPIVSPSCGFPAKGGRPGG